MTKETNDQQKRHLEKLGGEKLLEKLKKWVESPKV